MNSAILTSSSIRAWTAVGCTRMPRRPTTTKPNSSSRLSSRAVVVRSKPEEHFEPQELKVGECLLEDARDAMEACKGLSPEDEAACMLQHGCDASAVHQRLDSEEQEEKKKEQQAAGAKK